MNKKKEEEKERENRLNKHIQKDENYKTNELVITLDRMNLP